MVPSQLVLALRMVGLDLNSRNSKVQSVCVSRFFCWFMAKIFTFAIGLYFFCLLVCLFVLAPPTLD